MDHVPKTPEDVLDVIVRSERSRRFAWTAGRVILRCALRIQFRSLEYNERKLILKRIRIYLDLLAERGLLVRREEPQSIGFGNEVGFDHLLAPHPRPDRPSIFKDAEAFLKAPSPAPPDSPQQ
jgi:hypothetical protein